MQILPRHALAQTLIAIFALSGLTRCAPESPAPDPCYPAPERAAAFDLSVSIGGEPNTPFHLEQTDPDTVLASTPLFARAAVAAASHTWIIAGDTLRYEAGMPELAFLLAEHIDFAEGPVRVGLICQPQNPAFKDCFGERGGGPDTLFKTLYVADEAAWTSAVASALTGRYLCHDPAAPETRYDLFFGYGEIPRTDAEGLFAAGFPETCPDRQSNSRLTAGAFAFWDQMATNCGGTGVVTEADALDGDGRLTIRALLPVYDGETWAASAEEKTYIAIKTE